jgi:casein kinase 1
MSAQTRSSPSSTQSILTVGNHYRVGKKIGEGSFGVVFDGPSLLSPYINAQNPT